jgi:hypothetical protein
MGIISWTTPVRTVVVPVGPEIQNHVLIFVSRVMLVIRSKSKVQFFWKSKFQISKKKEKLWERITSITRETIIKT